MRSNAERVRQGAADGRITRRNALGDDKRLELRVRWGTENTRNEGETTRARGRERDMMTISCVSFCEKQHELEVYPMTLIRLAAISHPVCVTMTLSSFDEPHDVAIRNNKGY